MDYKATDAELTSIADAIRSKGGTLLPLTFPQEFIQAIYDLNPHAQRAYADGLFDDINDFTWECTAVIVTE